MIKGRNAQFRHYICNNVEHFPIKRCHKMPVLSPKQLEIKHFNNKVSCPLFNCNKMDGIASIYQGREHLLPGNPWITRLTVS
jgi:hypothetical protein